MYIWVYQQEYVAGFFFVRLLFSSFYVICGPCSFSLFCRQGGCPYAKPTRRRNVHDDAIPKIFCSFFRSKTR